jgi:eukaryotic-like serine/threonine-protein kinase
MSDPAIRLSAALGDRYAIERELGVGGMATVYLARDLKHDRRVAIKVLKPELAAVLGAERFVTEIKTTAALQHPNILPLHDSGEADGLLYYVMPYVEGESLREKLDRETQLGVDEAVGITREVADALDYAHAHGVVHRDIKPENILLHDGRPMVADFGIALAVSAAAGGRMTETGMSLGTPHYMSPEQATAEKDITGRSDIYSLASVLYEMLTGDPPHTGKSAQQIIAKIVTDTPRPVTELRKSVPPNVAAALAKALEKLPADRFESAKAFAGALTNPVFRHGAATGAAPTARGISRGAFATVAAAAVIAIAAAAWGWLRPIPVSSAPPMLMAFPFGADDSIGSTLLDSVQNFGRPSRTAFAFAPDGRTLVYAGNGGRLFLRPLAGRESTPIAGVDSAESPFFSPDGRSIGYWSEGHLRRVPVAGGPSTDIAAVDQIAGASWGEGDRIVIGVPGTGLIFLSATSATPPDTFADPNAVLPHFLPGARSLVFTEDLEAGGFGTRVAWLAVDSRKPETLMQDAADARYVPTGYLVFGREGVLLAVPFDASKHEVTGRPFTVLPDVMQAINGGGPSVFTGATQVAFSPRGQLAWITGGIDPDTRREVFELDRQGRATPLTGAGVHPFLSARLSPDGSRLALASKGRRSTLEIYDLARGSALAVPTTGPQVWTLWSPDGRRVVTLGGPVDSAALVSVSADGVGAPRRIGPPVLPAFWSADGATLYALGFSSNLLALDTAGDTVYEVPNLPGGIRSGVRYPMLSPDGRWLAYAASEPGSSALEVYVSPWPALDRKWKVSSGGGGSPVWTRGGRELIHLQSLPDDSIGKNRVRIWSVAVGPDSSRPPGVPHALSTSHFDRTGPLRSYDVSADGSRFFVILSLPVHAASGHMYVMSNWFEELERLSAEQGSGK